MAEEKKVLFSKSFRGYSRKDVNSYIIEENKRFSEKEERMRTENEKLCARVSELEGKISSLNDTANEMEREYSASLADKSKEISRLMNELGTSRSHFEADFPRRQNVFPISERRKSHAARKSLNLLKESLKHVRRSMKKSLNLSKAILRKAGSSMRTSFFLSKEISRERRRSAKKNLFTSHTG